MERIRYIPAYGHNDRGGGRQLAFPRRQLGLRYTVRERESAPVGAESLSFARHPDANVCTLSRIFADASYIQVGGACFRRDD